MDCSLTHRFPVKSISCRLTSIVLCLVVVSVSPLAADDSTSEITRWIEDLGHDQYLRREKASQELSAAGAIAIEPLIEAMKSGDLEVTERAVNVIMEIALASAPTADGGAWDQLNRLASKGAGQSASRAEAALSEIRSHRSRQARLALANSGAFIGLDQNFSLTVGQERLVLRIDDQWDASDQSLQWLRWLAGIENVMIQGSAASQNVLEQVVRLPDLKSLSIVDAEVDQATLEPLLKLHRIYTLEFRYVRLRDEYGELISKLPLRLSLDLIGTGISTETVDALKKSMPGLVITHRKGGFLGVRCFDNNDVCEINEVVSGSAAQRAGLIPGDIIVQVADKRVGAFKDLLEEISTHIPGDEMEIKIRRGGQIKTLKLTLGRFEQS